ncbi:hypothetical protein QBC35DRAFT_114486 [Podospora australis]|uniref:Metallo-beta-lactamase domain-containing protein n=1 Tax=Podospora australis TaxID=1536484 RepID=A0AAN6WN99_9PEZI|nr:hypothetical protein QBC35DRAFT_114486 [Podospora australis]
MDPPIDDPGHLQQNQNPIPSIPYYRVENWQIPVPIGDASAHFLIDRSRSYPDDPWQHHVVLHAFFMDGGEDPKWGGGTHTALGAIRAALKFIDGDMQYGTLWKFDAIVTTHHDRDHFLGLKQLLECEEIITRGGIQGKYRELYFTDVVTFYSGGDPSHGWRPDGLVTTCRHVVGQNCIGVDLFTKTRVFVWDGMDADTDRELGILNLSPEDLDPKQPRFAVVGANGYGAIQAGRLTPNPDKNETSILAIVYWPAENGRTSYYTGGDGNPRVLSAGVVAWMNRLNRRTTDPSIPVAMVKLDHHGSYKESLGGVSGMHESSLMLMHPHNILVTPGFTHGHPNWVVLEYVREYFTERERANLERGRLVTTRSPYWMLKKQAGAKDTNSNHANLPASIDVFAWHEADRSENDFVAYEQVDLDNETRDDEDHDQAEITGGQGDDKRIDEEDDLNDAGIVFGELFIQEARRFYGDNNELKRQTKLFIKRLRDSATEEARKQFFQEDGKPKMKEINKLLRRRQKKISSLGKFYTQSQNSHNNAMKGEPPMPNHMIKALEMQANRDMIIEQAKDTWASISDQRIFPTTHTPYFLVRFWFENGGQMSIDATRDQYGNVKEAPDQPVHVDPYEGYKLQHKEFETTIEYKKKPDAKTMKKAVYPDALGRLNDRLGFTAQEIMRAKQGPLNYSILSGMTNVLIDYMPSNRRLTNGKSWPSNSGLTYLAPEAFAGTLSSLTAAASQLELADFTNIQIEGGLDGKEKYDFTGDLPELLSFPKFVEKFVEKYAHRDYKLKYDPKDYELKKARLLKWQSTKKIWKELAEQTTQAKLKHLRKQWEKLIQHQMNTTVPQYQKTMAGQMRRQRELQAAEVAEISRRRHASAQIAERRGVFRTGKTKKFVTQGPDQFGQVADAAGDEEEDDSEDSEESWRRPTKKE